MVIYLVGDSIGDPNKKIWEFITHRLVSYYEKPNLKNDYSGKKLFLDSGAFSAFTRKKTIDLDTYIAFIKKHQKQIYIYANLDVIGHVKDSWKNQRKMERAGLHPLPVYHVEDDIKYLYRCIDNYEHFAIGGMAKGFGSEHRAMFLDKCWKIVESENKGNRIHGFGITSIPLMRRYNWDSVDSTRWVMAAGSGTILMPKYKNGQFEYTNREISVHISTESSFIKKRNAHYLSMSPYNKKIIDNYLKSIGYTFEDVSSTYIKRREVNVLFYNKVAEELTKLKNK